MMLATVKHKKTEVLFVRLNGIFKKQLQDISINQKYLLAVTLGIIGLYLFEDENNNCHAM